VISIDPSIEYGLSALPCPFCSSTAECSVAEGHVKYRLPKVKVKCTQCWCKTPAYECAGTTPRDERQAAAEALAAWNTRAIGAAKTRTAA
jgi:hypothetical protein